MSDAIEDSVKSHIAGLETQRCRALVAGDVDGLRKLMTDDCMILHGSGKVESREPYLASVFERLNITSLEQFDLVVRLYGDATAVATCNHAMTVAPASAPDAPRVSRANFTAVWCKGPEGWLLNTLHGTRLPTA